MIKKSIAIAAAGAAVITGCSKPQVKVINLPELHVAYVEYKGDYEANGEIYDIVLKPLLDWAVPAGLWNFPDKTKLIVAYPDSDETPKEKKRMWMAITVPEGTRPPQGIKLMDIPGGLYASGSFEISSEEFGEAWGYMYSKWIPENGYYPTDALCFEIKKNDSDEHAERKHLVDICIPVKKIR